MEAGDNVLDPENGSSLLNTDLSTLNNQFETACRDEVVRLLNALKFDN